MLPISSSKHYIRECRFGFAKALIFLCVQVYLGGFVNDVDAARSHDIMSLWCKGWHVASLNYAAEVYSVLKPFASLLSVVRGRAEGIAYAESSVLLQ